MKSPCLSEDFPMPAAHLGNDKTGCLAKRLLQRSRSWTHRERGPLVRSPSWGRCKCKRRTRPLCRCSPPVAAVTARSASPDGSYQEETGNCLLWALGDRIYTLGDLHTLMTGEDGPSDRVADQIVVKFGNWASRAELVWPRKERRDAHQVDIAILELEPKAIVAQPFAPETFQSSTGGLPRQLYLAAPGHRATILPIVAPAVAYGSQWFLYHELAHGDSGGMVFALEDGRVVPQGLVSSIGSIPGQSARGTVMWNRDAMRIFIKQFLEARAKASLRASGQGGTGEAQKVGP